MLASFLPGLREIRTPLAVGYAWLFVGYLVIGHNFPKPDQATGVLHDVYDMSRLVTPVGVAVAASVLAYLIGIVVAPLASPPRLRLPWWITYRVNVQTAGDRVEDALGAVVVDRLADRIRDNDDFRAEVVRHSVDIGQSAGVVIDPALLEELLRKQPEARRDAVANVLDTSELVAEIQSGLPLVAERMRALDDQAGTKYDRLRAEGAFRGGMAVPLLAFVLTLAVRGSLWWLFALVAPVLLFAAASAARRDAQLLLVSVLAARRYDDRMVQLLDSIPAAQILSREPDRWALWAPEAVRVVRAVAVSPDAKVVAGATMEGEIHLWDTESGELLRTLSGHRGAVLSLAFSPGGELLLSGSEDRSARVWDPATGVERQRLEHTEPVMAVAVNRDGVFVTGTLRQLSWWYQEGQRPSQVSLGAQWLEDMALDPDSKLLAVGLEDGTLRVFVGETPVDLGVYEHLSLAGWSGLDPFVAGFARGAENELRTWDPLTGRQMYPATVIEQALRRPAVARPRGHVVAVPNDHEQVLLLDVESGDVLATLEGHHASLTSLAWANDGDLLASAAEDGTVILWDVHANKSRLRLVPPAPVSSEEPMAPVPVASAAPAHLLAAVTEQPVPPIPSALSRKAAASRRTSAADVV